MGAVAKYLDRLPEGVSFTPLKVFSSNEGRVMHIMRADSPAFEKFGEVYVSTVMPSAIKAWKRHRVMAQNLTVPAGEIDFFFFDDRMDSPTSQTFTKIRMTPVNYGLLQIPPMLWYGFRGAGPTESLIVNCATLPHDPDEVERTDLNNKLFPDIKNF